MTFKDYYKKIKKKKKNTLPQANNTHSDSSNMPGTAALPAASAGMQPRLSWCIYGLIFAMFINIIVLFFDMMGQYMESIELWNSWTQALGHASIK